MTDINVSENILDHRKRMGYTQSDIADFLNISKAAVSKWEKGHSIPEVTYLARLAVLFDTTIDELVNYSPQLSKHEIRKIYLELSAMFETHDYSDVLSSVEGYSNRYYSCYPLLTVLVGLLINHVRLADAPSDTYALADGLIERVLEYSDSIHLKEQSVFFRATIRLAEQKPDDVIGMLSDFSLPKVPLSTVLAQSYMMNKEAGKAKQVLQIETYQNILFIMNDLTMMLYSDVHDDRTQVIERGVGMDRTFDLKALHPNSMLNFYLAAAMKTTGDKSECLHYLDEFLQCMKNLAEDYYIHGDAFFSEIDDWIADFALGNHAPVKLGVARGQILSIVEHSGVFDEIKDDIAFKNFIHNLKKVLEVE